MGKGEKIPPLPSLATSPTLLQCPCVRRPRSSLTPSFWIVYGDLIAKPSETCLFRFFLASLCSMPSSRARGRTLWNEDDLYDLPSENVGEKMSCGQL